MSENEKKDGYTAKDVATIAAVAYIGTKAFKAAAHTVGNTYCFIKARKDNKSEK